MNNTCPYCNNSVEKIVFGKTTMRICPHCYATFLPADRFMSVRREIDEGSRRKLMEFMHAHAADFVSPANLKCIDHQEPLVEGSIPEYVVPGLVPTCCNMQHLPPQLWSDLLLRGLKNPLRKTATSKYDRNTLMNNLRRKVLAILDKDYGAADPLEGLFYSMNIEPVLLKKSNPS